MFLVTRKLLCSLASRSKIWLVGCADKAWRVRVRENAFACVLIFAAWLQAGAIHTWWLRPLSHLRFYRAILSHECGILSRDKVADAAPVELQRLRLCRVNKHGFCTTFLVSRSSFTNTVPKWRNSTICNLSWALRLIVRFRSARQPAKTKLLTRIS